MKAYTLVVLLAAVLITGCSSTGNVNNDGISAVSIEQAKTEFQKYRGTKVRWGGTILNVKNQKDFSTIEVLRYPLQGSEPNDKTRAEGRFMIKVSDFIDPEEYKSPNRITVTGTLQSIQNGQVGNYPYSYPVIQADKVQFFKGEKIRVINDPYWWSHPYYRPWPYWRGGW